MPSHYARGSTGALFEGETLWPGGHQRNPVLSRHQRFEGDSHKVPQKQLIYIPCLLGQMLGLEPNSYLEVTLELSRIWPCAVLEPETPATISGYGSMSLGPQVTGQHQVSES